MLLVLSFLVLFGLILYNVTKKADIPEPQGFLDLSPELNPYQFTDSYGVLTLPPIVNNNNVYTLTFGDHHGIVRFGKNTEWVYPLYYSFKLPDIVANNPNYRGSFDIQFIHHPVEDPLGGTNNLTFTVGVNFLDPGEGPVTTNNYISFIDFYGSITPYNGGDVLYIILYSATSAELKLNSTSLFTFNPYNYNSIYSFPFPDRSYLLIRPFPEFTGLVGDVAQYSWPTNVTFEVYGANFPIPI